MHCPCQLADQIRLHDRELISLQAPIADTETGIVFLGILKPRRQFSGVAIHLQPAVATYQGLGPGGSIMGPWASSTDE